MPKSVSKCWKTPANPGKFSLMDANEQQTMCVGRSHAGWANAPNRAVSAALSGKRKPRADPGSRARYGDAWLVGCRLDFAGDVESGPFLQRQRFVFARSTTSSARPFMTALTTRLAGHLARPVVRQRPGIDVRLMGDEKPLTFGRQGSPCRSVSRLVLSKTRDGK